MSSYTLDEREERRVRALIAERAQQRNAKLEALRKDIAEGLERGPPEPLRIDAIKAMGRRRLAEAGRS